MSAAAHERTVTVEGRRLEVAVHARDGSRVPLVLLHEGLGSVTMWREFPMRLADATGRTTIVYSRYGYGDSDVLQQPRDIDYMHHEGRAVLPALLDALDVPEAVLFGHSDGASIALLAAAAHPRRVRALVLEAPHVFVEDLTVASIARVRDAYAAAGDTLRRKLARYHRDADATFRGWNDIWLDPRFRAWDIAAGLEAVEAPVLVVQGNDDEYGTRAQADAIASRARHASVTLLDACGHSPHRDRPDAVLETVERFLAALP